MNTYDFLLNGAELAEQYQNSTSKEEKEQLVKKVFTGVYFNLNRLLYTNNEEDFNSDFAIYFYDKIPTLLSNYNPEYASFITYITVSLKLSFKTFYQKEKVKEEAEDVTLSEEKFRISSSFDSCNNWGDYNLYVSDPAALYTKDMLSSDDSKIKCRSRKDSSYRQPGSGLPKNKTKDNSFYFSMTYKERLIFLLACKSCLFLDDDFTEKIANEINLPVKNLDAILEKLRNHCMNRQSQMDKLMLKRNFHYIKMRTASKLLDSSSANKNSLYVKNMKSRKLSYNVWRNSNKLDKKQIKYPSNRLIGKYLNISKSSVDYNLEKAFKELYT